MEQNDLRMVIKVAKMYYELKLKQEEIAIKENLSKSKVSRLLNKAVEEGYVKFSVTYPIKSVNELEKEFIDVFKLKRVFIAPIIVEDKFLIMKDVCIALASDLTRIINEDDVVAISWGNTLNSLSNNLIPINKKGIKIVQLNGGIAKNVRPTRSENIITNFAKVYEATGYILPVPAIVDNKKIADTIMEDSQINFVLNLAINARVAIFTVGSVSSESILIDAGYFTKDEYEDMKEMGAVGDICTRYFNIKGELIDKDLNGRAIGISLDALKAKDYSIGIGVGIKKANAILGALRGGYMNSLYTDEITAKEVLKIYYNL